LLSVSFFPSWQAEARTAVSLLEIPRIQPGAWLDVRYDPESPSRVAIVASAGHDPSGGSVPPALDPQILGDDIEVSPLAEGVWRHVSYHELPDYGRVPANGLIVVSGSKAALIDTPWTDDQTARLITWVDAELEAQVTVVVPSHLHQDCMGGLAAAHAAGARSYASAATGRLAAAAGLEPPQNLFAERLQLRLGSRTLVLHHAGPGHTADTIVVWLEDVQLLFAGDLSRSGTATSLGYTAEADLDSWPATIKTLLQEYPSANIVVPGHGQPGGRELLEHTLDLLAARGP
jgi:metallo-beta-lactamase class B